MYLGHIKKIHFVGIGGIGMSGIAEILTNYDLEISGCDLKRSPVTTRLERRGIRIAFGHDPSHVESADLVVISSAVRLDHPELERARELRIPVIKRAEMLGELTRLKRTVAVAGTHGKTTTSAMTAMILSEAGLDPTLIVGGVIRSIETNARLGLGEYLVVEADEYDRTFLVLHPTIAIITNVEADHLDIYSGIDEIRATFSDFAAKVPFYGVVIGCVDDPAVAAILEPLSRRVVGYGLSEGASLRALDLEYGEGSTRFAVVRQGERLGEVTLNVPGTHNVLNALAAIGAALALEVPFEAAARALDGFTGVERRFQVLGDFRGAIVVDDYAHHPTEIRATLDAARRAYPRRRLVALFQPHLYSRTRDFHQEFADALGIADMALVAPIYPSREEPIEGVTSELITSVATSAAVKAVGGTLEEIAGELREVLGENDLFVTMGAGDVHVVGEMLVGGAA